MQAIRVISNTKDTTVKVDDHATIEQLLDKAGISTTGKHMVSGGNVMELNDSISKLTNSKIQVLVKDKNN